MKRLQSLSSSKFLIQYHFIFVCKYRRKVMEYKLFNDDLKQEMLNIATKYDFKIGTLETDIDHIHLLIESIPRLSPSQICRVLKQESTVNLWKNIVNTF